MAENIKKSLLWERKSYIEVQVLIKKGSSNMEKITPISEYNKRELQQIQSLKRNVSVSSLDSACALLPAGMEGSAPATPSNLCMSWYEQP